MSPDAAVPSLLGTDEGERSINFNLISHPNSLLVNLVELDS